MADIDLFKAGILLIFDLDSIERIGLKRCDGKDRLASVTRTRGWREIGFV
jgi:hypothetical protein